MLYPFELSMISGARYHLVATYSVKNPVWSWLGSATRANPKSQIWNPHRVSKNSGNRSILEAGKAYNRGNEINVCIPPMQVVPFSCLIAVKLFKNCLPILSFLRKLVNRSSRYTLKHSSGCVGRKRRCDEDNCPPSLLLYFLCFKSASHDAHNPMVEGAILPALSLVHLLPCVWAKVSQTWTWMTTYPGPQVLSHIRLCV